MIMERVKKALGIKTDRQILGEAVKEPSIKEARKQLKRANILLNGADNILEMYEDAEKERLRILGERASG